MRKRNCILCDGTGEIESPQNRWENAQNMTRAVKRLRTEGYSYGEIQKLLKIKTKHQVAYHAKKGESVGNKSENEKNYIAKLFIEEMPKTKEANERIITWLREKALEIEICDPHDYAEPFTARLI